MILLSLIGVLFLQSVHVFAGEPVELRESYAGNLSFALTGGSMLDGNNCNDNISTRTSNETMSSIPNSANITAAWLYWAGSYNPSTGSGQNTPDTTVTFSTPTGSHTVTDSSPYTTAWGEDTSDPADPDEAYFNGRADVTSYVSGNGNGNYSVSNLSVHTGNPHCNFNTIIAGWALILVYEDDGEPFRVVNIFDGFQYYYGSALVLTPDNFTVSSNPSGKHAHITWEGDANNSGNRNGFSESLQFQGIDLTDANNPANNQFNSYSNSLGATTRGLDIDEYQIDSSYINPGETSATTLYSTGGDMVFLTSEVFSITNIPVADLSVTTSTPSGWLQGSTANKQFTITNNGPNDIPINSVQFSAPLPSGVLDLTANQGSLDWDCSIASNTLTCLYKPKLRSGWSAYLDVEFIINGNTSDNADFTVSVNHNNAPYDIFDNQAINDAFTVSAPITGTASVDLSSSTKTYTDVSGDLLLAGDTLRYTITIDDANDLPVNGISVTDDLPPNIISATLISSPPGSTNSTSSSGGANGTGFINISNINLAAGETAEVVFDVVIDTNAVEGASLRNVANISDGSTNWQVDTGPITLTVIKPDLSPSQIEAYDKNGGLLESGDTITVQITLDDLYDTDITTLQTTLAIPALIDSFTVINPHTGSDLSSTFIDIQNISFSGSETPILEFDFVMDPAATDGTTFDFSAELTIGSDVWVLTAPTLTVVNSQPAASGNKPLYLVNNDLVRTRPSVDAASPRFIGNQDPILEWAILPSLASSLTIASGDFPIELAIEGNQTVNNNETELVIELYYDENQGAGRQLMASGSFPRVRYDNNQFYDMSLNLNLPADITMAAGSSIFLTLDNITYNRNQGTVRPNNNQNHRVYIHHFNGSFYSAVTLNATTVINVENIQVFSAPFNDTNSDFVDDSGATVISQSQMDTTLSVRADISDPFGAFDISNATVSITKADSSALLTNSIMAAIDDPSDDNSTASKTFEQTFTLAEDSEPLGDWVISVTGFEGLEGDVEHTQVNTFRVIPFQPNINLNKTVTVVNDPINGISNPKAIPGAELKYNIQAINTGRGFADDGSVSIQDEIATDAELFIGNLTCIGRGPGSGAGPVCFKDGTTPNESGLTYDFNAINDLIDNVQFSQDGIDFTYEPVNGGDDYDDTIRFIRITPIGNLSASDKAVSFEPQFNFEYQIRLK